MKVQGLSRHEFLPYRSRLQPLYVYRFCVCSALTNISSAAWYALIMSIIVLAYVKSPDYLDPLTEVLSRMQHQWIHRLPTWQLGNGSVHLLVRCLSFVGVRLADSFVVTA